MPALKNPRHELVARYIAEGMTAVDAVSKVGISLTGNRASATQMAGVVSRREDVQNRVMELREKAAARTEITVQRVLNELANIGFANMMDYVKIQEDGTAYVDLKDVTREKAAAISEIVVDEYVEGRGEEARPVKRTRFKLHDKRAALLDIGKHLGMFREKVEVTGKNGAPIQIQNNLEVSLLNRDEREMLKQLLLLAAERKNQPSLEQPTLTDVEYESE